MNQMTSNDHEISAKKNTKLIQTKTTSRHGLGVFRQESPAETGPRCFGTEALCARGPGA